MALRVVAWNDIAQRLVRTDKDPADIVGGVVLDTIDMGSVAITTGSTSKTVTYNITFSSADAYALVVNLTNLVDGSVQFQPVIVTSKTTTGFTAIWNAPTDSGNYYIDYIAVVPVLSFKANVESLLSGITTNTSALLSALSYATIPQMVNEIDTTPLILHPVNITYKDSTDFSTSWNRATDTVNYMLHWMATFTSSSMLKSGATAISNGSTSLTVPFVFPALSTADYALIPRMSNIVDGSTIYQPITVTSKTMSNFTAKWNQPVDSANYKLEWILKTL
jgi:hypothetical protein